MPGNITVKGDNSLPGSGVGKTRNILTGPCRSDITSCASPLHWRCKKCQQIYTSTETSLIKVLVSIKESGSCKTAVLTRFRILQLGGPLISINCVTFWPLTFKFGYRLLKTWYLRKIHWYFNGKLSRIIFLWRFFCGSIYYLSCNMLLQSQWEGSVLPYTNWILYT